MIADFTNFNVVTSDSVTGTVTLRLQDVPWDQALDIILQAKGLGVRKTGNVLWIAPKEEIAAKEKLELESKATVLSLEPVRTQAFKLSYAKAKDVAVQLAATAAGTGTNANSSRVLSARGSAVAEPRTNQLFVQMFRASWKSAADDCQTGHSRATSAHRGAHRRSRRYLRPVAGRQVRQR